MASSPENTNMALFCDFENVALGVRDANYDKFDIGRVLERLLLKGSIVVKKAYCDWDRYKSFKATMHEANFELIEIPHVRQSGKNSADIRLVVDALDLCYTKSHVDTFVIISGDSDFSPLVSKLRENAKQVIGVGVKQSTSDLLIANCDEFIFYDDLVSESRRSVRRDAREAAPAPKRSPEEEKRRREEAEARRGEAIRIAVETFDALLDERGDGGKIWASMLKQAIKRRKPDFNENHYGFRAFGNLLDEAHARGLFEVGRDEKSGAYVYRGKALEEGGGEEARSIESAALDAGSQAQADAGEGGARRSAAARNGKESGGKESGARNDGGKGESGKVESAKGEGAKGEGGRNDAGRGEARGRQAEATSARAPGSDVKAAPAPAARATGGAQDADPVATAVPDLPLPAPAAGPPSTVAEAAEAAAGGESGAAAVAPIPGASAAASQEAAPGEAEPPRATRRRSTRTKAAPAAADEAASAPEAGGEPAPTQADAPAPAKPKAAPRRRTRKADSAAAQD